MTRILLAGDAGDDIMPILERQKCKTEVVKRLVRFILTIKMSKEKFIVILDASVMGCIGYSILKHMSTLKIQIPALVVGATAEEVDLKARGLGEMNCTFLSKNNTDGFVDWLIENIQD